MIYKKNTENTPPWWLPRWRH